MFVNSVFSLVCNSVKHQTHKMFDHRLKIVQFLHNISMFQSWNWKLWLEKFENKTVGLQEGCCLKHFFRHQTIKHVFFPKKQVFNVFFVFFSTVPFRALAPIYNGNWHKISPNFLSSSVIRFFYSIRRAFWFWMGEWVVKWVRFQVCKKEVMSSECPSKTDLIPV